MRRLIVRPGAIGDFIVSLPALECLKGDYLEVWTSGANCALARFADRARSISSTGLDLLGITDPDPNLVVDLKSFDSIVSWYGTNRPEFRRITEELNLPFRFFTALPPDSHGNGPGTHASDFYLNQVRSIADCASDGIPRIDCAATREDYAVIHPFSGSPGKNWPLDKFRQMAAGLGRRMPVRWCAGPEDPPLPDAVRIADLFELGCWLARAQLYVGNDSGITHLAAAVGTPVLAIFGPTDPAVWAPRGSNVRVMRWGEAFERSGVHCFRGFE